MAGCKQDQDTRGEDKQQRPYDYEDSSSMAHG
jgi:hypothetical protein